MKTSIVRILQLIVGKPIRFLKSITALDAAPPRSLFETLHIHAIGRSAEFATLFMKSAVMCASRRDVWEYCIQKLASRDKNSQILEFGVFEGESINYLARRMKDATVYGFDSFLGLEEDWQGYIPRKGHFDRKGQIPIVESNVILIKGWFEETVPNFKKNFKQNVNLLHIDCDTYKPTKYVLEQFSKQFTKGTIVIFDEFFGYPGWENHEYRAWTEYVNRHKRKFEYIAFSNLSVAVEILD
jgi:predicted O-methyltransferase YrrM